MDVAVLSNVLGGETSQTFLELSPLLEFFISLPRDEQILLCTGPLFSCFLEDLENEEQYWSDLI